MKERLLALIVQSPKVNLQEPKDGINTKTNYLGPKILSWMLKLGGSSSCHSLAWVFFIWVGIVTLLVVAVRGADQVPFI